MLLWLLFSCADRKDGALGNGEFAFLKFAFIFFFKLVLLDFCFVNSCVWVHVEVRGTVHRSWFSPSSVIPGTQLSS